MSFSGRIYRNAQEKKRHSQKLRGWANRPRYRDRQTDGQTRTKMQFFRTVA